MVECAPAALFLADEAATKGLGAALAEDLRPGGIVCLFGTLGAGKTALIRAIIRQLQRGAGQNPEQVPSPTYTLLQTYEAGDLIIRHFDLYRVEHPPDIYELGWEEALTGGLALVEWPERLGALLPEDRLEIHLSYMQGTGREARFTLAGAWSERALHAVA